MNRWDSNTPRHYDGSTFVAGNYYRRTVHMKEETIGAQLCKHCICTSNWRTLLYLVMACSVAVFVVIVVLLAVLFVGPVENPETNMTTTALPSSPAPGIQRITGSSRPLKSKIVDTTNNNKFSHRQRDSEVTPDTTTLNEVVVQASSTLSTLQPLPPSLLAEHKPQVVAEVIPLSDNLDYSSEGEAVPIVADFNEQFLLDVGLVESTISAVLESEQTSHLIEQPKAFSVSSVKDSTRDSLTSDVTRSSTTTTTTTPSSLIVDYATELDLLGDVKIHSYIVNGSDTTMTPSLEEGGDQDQVAIPIRPIEATFSEWNSEKSSNEDLSNGHDGLLNLNNNQLAVTDKNTWTSDNNKDLGRTEVVPHNGINSSNGHPTNSDVNEETVGDDARVQSDEFSTIYREVTTVVSSHSSELATHYVSASNGSLSVQEVHQSTHRPELPSFESVAFDNTGWSPLPHETFYSWLLRRSNVFYKFPPGNDGPLRRPPLVPSHFSSSDQRLGSWNNNNSPPKELLPQPSSGVELTTTASIVPFVPVPTVYTGTEAAVQAGVNFTDRFHPLSGIRLADDILSHLVYSDVAGVSNQPVTDAPLSGVNREPISLATTFSQLDGPSQTPYKSENVSHEEDVLKNNGDHKEENKGIIPSIDLLDLESELKNDDNSGNEEYLTKGTVLQSAVNNNKSEISDSFLLSEKEYGLGYPDVTKVGPEMSQESIQSGDRSTSRVVVSETNKIIMNSEVDDELVEENKLSTPFLIQLDEKKVTSSYPADGRVEGESSNDWTGSLIGITVVNSSSSTEDLSSTGKNKSFLDKKVNLDKKQAGHAVPSSDASSSEDWLIVPSSDSRGSSVASSMLLSSGDTGNHVPLVSKDLTTILSTSRPEWQEAGYRRDSDMVSSELIRHADDGLSSVQEFKEVVQTSKDEIKGLTAIESSASQHFIPSKWPATDKIGAVNLRTTETLGDYHHRRSQSTAKVTFDSEASNNSGNIIKSPDDFWKPSSMYLKPSAGPEVVSIENESREVTGMAGGNQLRLQPVSAIGTFHEVSLSLEDLKELKQQPAVHRGHLEPSTILLTVTSENVDVGEDAVDTTTRWTLLLPTVRSTKSSTSDSFLESIALSGSTIATSTPLSEFDAGRSPVAATSNKSVLIPLDVNVEANLSVSSLPATTVERKRTSETTTISPEATVSKLFSDMESAAVSLDSEGHPRQPPLSLSNDGSAVRPSVLNLFDIISSNTKQAIRQKNELDLNRRNHSYLEVRENTRRLI